MLYEIFKEKTENFNFVPKVTGRPESWPTASYAPARHPTIVVAIVVSQKKAIV